MSKDHVRQFQAALAAAGFSPGNIDGDFGPGTFTAWRRLLVSLKPVAPTAPADVNIPDAWLPMCRMDRIILHWTAGGNEPSPLDAQHYHFMIAGDGMVHRGLTPVNFNASPMSAHYAAHTKDCNTGSIGVAFCGMRGAQESPLAYGPSPINETQWHSALALCRALRTRYGIANTRQTILSHAEVQPTLGIKQNGKWDISVIPWAPSVRGAVVVGDKFRAEL